MIFAALNRICLATFHTACVHLESGLHFDVIPDARDSVVDFAETKQTSLLMLTTDKPASMGRDSHLVYSVDLETATADLYQVASIQGLRDGMLNVITEQQDWDRLPVLTDETGLILTTESQESITI